MAQKVNRRPIKNFFVKKALQMRMIRNIVLSAFISTIVSSSSLFLVYYLRYKTVVVYQLDRITQDLSRENILSIILPALVISAIVSIILALGIGLYSSRKYAVPIYKLEQWLSLLIKGKIGASLQFREKEEMKELSDKCNKLGSELQTIFQKIHNSVETLKENKASPEVIQDFENILSRIDLDADPIKVSTTYCKIIKDDEENPKES
jgi:methyl-accepting chemotaxis protein